MRVIKNAADRHRRSRRLAPSFETCPNASARRFEASPALATELNALRSFRTDAVTSVHRNGSKVSVSTANANEKRLLAFFAFLAIEKSVLVETLQTFVSPKIGPVVQQYIEFKATTCTFGSIANDLSAFVAAARFVVAVRKARASPGQAVAGTDAVDTLPAMLKQCKAQKLEDLKFRGKPDAWLDWAECQNGRLAAERALAAYADNKPSRKLKLVRDVCLLRLLTGLPPDRVAVYRTLRMGGTLKATGDGAYQLDLSEPGIHKVSVRKRVPLCPHTPHIRVCHMPQTSSKFGPTKTTVTESVAAAITTLVTLDKLVDGEYLFHAKDRAKPHDPTMWGRFVKAIFKTYTGVGTCAVLWNGTRDTIVC